MFEIKGKYATAKCYAKVCEDAENLYFYVDTADALSPSTDGGWMTLFLNTSGKTGYDYIVNRTSPADGKTAVEAVADGGRTVAGEAEIRFEGNRLMLRGVGLNETELRILGVAHAGE